MVMNDSNLDCLIDNLEKASWETCELASKVEPDPIQVRARILHNQSLVMDVLEVLLRTVRKEKDGK